MKTNFLILANLNELQCFRRFLLKNRRTNVRSGRSKNKYFQDILDNQLNLQKFYFFHLRLPFNFHFLNGMGKVLQIGELGGPHPSNQAWKIGPLKRNTPCDIPPGNCKNIYSLRSIYSCVAAHETFWFIMMNPGTNRCVVR